MNIKLSFNMFACACVCVCICLLLIHLMNECMYISFYSPLPKKHYLQGGVTEKKYNTNWIKLCKLFKYKPPPHLPKKMSKHSILKVASWCWWFSIDCSTKNKNTNVKQQRSILTRFLHEYRFAPPQKKCISESSLQYN